ncbi:hypothetical protein O9H85_29775 [Paenibacillus filicis]|uniref:Uncharacterized protein n=1 Tax=Paenibacillus gyeongsangnamensis TaxID=3388067 RepID=A0ABT4QI23_9BACL|nr:hypothetical protein [Paenibacillus filicis]MCZ8516504.1 hypothetical protein [Paenibacillus filicis]
MTNAMELRQLQWQQLLTSLECRLTIVRVDGRAVQSNYTTIKITYLDAGEIRFDSELDFPQDHRITIGLELFTAHHSIRLLGSRIEKKGVRAPYAYRVKYDMPAASRSFFFGMINQMAVHAQTFTAKAVESYNALQPYPQLYPQIDFQT